MIKPVLKVRFLTINPIPGDQNVGGSGGITPPTAQTSPTQEIPGNQPVFTVELLKDGTHREEILAALQEEDPAINNIRGDENTLGIEYARTAKLFGVFETRFTETVTVRRNGDIRVDLPWWLAFATRDDADHLDKRELTQNTIESTHYFQQMVLNMVKQHGNSMSQMVNNTR